jgi:predicted metal-dependent hydrolase
VPHPYTHYFSHYPENIQAQVDMLICGNKLLSFFKNKYPVSHTLKNDKLLFEFTNELKQKYLKNAPKLQQVQYKKQKDLVKNALGTHTFKRQQHGGKLKAKHEIAIAEQLRLAPEPLLKALVVHELVHFKEKEHNKSFYNLCCHMEPEYHQLELELRLFLVLQQEALSFY